MKITKLLLLSVALFNCVYGWGQDKEMNTFVEWTDTSGKTGTADFSNYVNTTNDPNYFEAALGILKDATKIKLITTGTAVWNSAKVSALRASLGDDRKLNGNSFPSVGAIAANTTLIEIDASTTTFTSGPSLSSTFMKCTALEKVIFPEIINTGATTLNSTFNGCTSLVEVKNLDKFEDIKSFKSPFMDCTNLKEVSFNSNANTTANADVSQAFQNCTNIERIINFDRFKTIHMTNLLNQTFMNCDKLQSIKLDITNITDFSAAKLTNAFRDIKTNNLLVYIPNNDWTNLWTNIKYYVIKEVDSENYTYNGSLALTNKLTFPHIPTDFTAASITYTRTFPTDLETGMNGVAQGWDTMILPFEVTSIKNGEKELAPITSATYINNKETILPFFLREFAPDGNKKFKEVATITPNLPYIIAMPNNAAYDPKYNITGDVTFTGTVMKATGSLEAANADAEGFKLKGTYEAIAQNGSVYALNSGVTDGENLHGSVFVTNTYDVTPYQAYIINPTDLTPSPAKRMYNIGNDDGGATGLEKNCDPNKVAQLSIYQAGSSLVIESPEEQNITIYGIDGRTIRKAQLDRGMNTIGGIANGIYIINQQKVIIK